MLNILPNKSLIVQTNTISSPKITTSFEQITNSSENVLPFFPKKAYSPEQILIRPHKCYFVWTDNSFDRRNLNLLKQISYSSLLEAYSSEQIYTQFVLTNSFLVRTYSLFVQTDKYLYLFFSFGSLTPPFKTDILIIMNIRFNYLSTMASRKSIFENVFQRFQYFCASHVCL